MNYLDYTRKNIPLGEKGWLANIFGGRNKNTDNWDKKTGSVTIGGKTYSTNDRNDVVALQDYLIDKGYNLGVTKGTGYFGKNTQAALNKHFASPTPVTTQSSTQPQAQVDPSFFTNAKNAVTSWFTKDEEPENSWDKSTGAVSLDGKTYNTSNRNDVIALQNYLIGKGHDVGRTGADGQFGKNTQAALAASLSGQKNNRTEHANAVAKENIKKFVTNVANPFTRTQGLIDGALYLADRAGLPTHMTNYLRDLNVSLPYRAKSAIRAGVDTMLNDKSFQENYNNALENPRAFVRFTSATPLTNSEKNYSDEELRILKEQAGKDYTISNSDIKRVSGNYGGNGDLSDMLFNPQKTVQLSIGRSQKGDAQNKIIYDTFDVNTQGATAQKDNEKYREMAQKNKGLNYATLRATMPTLNMIDIVPEQYKINSAIQI